MLPAERATDAAYHRHWEALDPSVSQRVASGVVFRFASSRRIAIRTWNSAKSWGASRGKAEGVYFLRDHHGIDPARVIAIGDQRNDLPHARGRGLGRCHGQTPVAPVKAVADIVIGPHTDHGIAAWIEAGRAPKGERCIGV